MCGLAGEIRFDQRPASVDRVSRMARTQSRRGPDGSGIFGYGKVALGHSRLKIIDLTDRGRQPMMDITEGGTSIPYWMEDPFVRI